MIGVGWGKKQRNVRRQLDGGKPEPPNVKNISGGDLNLKQSDKR